MKTLTPIQRLAIVDLLIDFKRFWQAEGTAAETATATTLVDRVVLLVRLSEEREREHP